MYNKMFPVAVVTSKGNVYPVEKDSLQINLQQGTVKLKVEPYLAYDNEDTFIGPWRVYFAAGVSKELPSIVYGIDRDESYSSPSAGVKRILLNADGSYTYVEAFPQLPAHNLRRCVMDDLATRHVNYYLSPADSSLKADGTAADLTGADGDVMVEIPIAYYRIDHYTDTFSHTHTVKLISDKPFPGSAPFPAFYVSDGGETLRKQYIGAFKASVDSNSKCRSVAGVKPATSKLRSAFRSAAVTNGGTLTNFLLKCWIGWLAEIEFASTDVQSSVSKGFSEISSYNADRLRYCGRTSSLGNGTGQIIADSEEGGDDYDLESYWKNGASKVVACSYRGIEDPWGACWEFGDGIQKYQDDVSGDYTKSGYWFTTDTSKYSMLDSDQSYGPANTPFPASGNTGANLAWVSQAWPKSSGYLKLYDHMTYFPTDVSGSSTTYLCDRFDNTGNANARNVLYGGHLSAGENDGAYTLDVQYNLVSGLAFVSARLAC